MSQKPPIRVLHQMACSGGSILCQCLAAMPDVALLSEVHPEMGMLARANPLKQAQQAYNLVNQQELAAHFAQQIHTIHQNAARRSMMLLLRDHLHADFISPGHFAHRIVDALEATAPLIRVATVRHPIDVWLGLQHNGWLEWTIEQFCARLVHVARSADATGFVRYEDFTIDPDAELGQLCTMIQLDFDPSCRDRLESVAHITGASGRQSTTIEPRPRRACTGKMIDTFNACPAYHEVLDTLGYQHPGAYDHIDAHQTIPYTD